VGYAPTTSLFVVFVALLVVPAAFAGMGKPVRMPTGNQSVTFDAGIACSFPLYIDVLVDREVTTIWPGDKNGDVRIGITGTLVFRLSNALTGSSLVVDASGPVTVVVHPDGSQLIDFRGNSVVILQPGATPPGPQTFYLSGRGVETATPDGHFTLVSVSGTTSDPRARLR
jgi:hypothetical protein